MKILYISYDGMVDPLGRSQILPLLRSLAKKGAVIYALSFEKKSSAEEVKKLRDILTKESISWRPLRYHKKPQVFSTFFDVLAGLINSLIITVKRRPEIIHCRSYVACSIAFFLRLLIKARLIFDMRGYWPEERVAGGIWQHGSAIYRLAKYMERVYVKNADLIVVLTHRMKEVLIREYGLRAEKIKVIPIFVDLDEFKLQPVQSAGATVSTGNIKELIAGKTVLVYSGSLGTVYMLNDMLDFYQVLKSTLPDLYFLFLTKSNKEIVSESVFRHGISTEDFSVIAVDYNQMNYWLNLAKLAIAFYKPEISAIGRSPTKIGEYLACGLPVVVNRGVGDIDEIIDREAVGTVIEGLSESEYNKALPKISNLLSQPYLREQCRRVSKKYFDLEDAADRYMGLYRDIDKEGA